jgi:3-hydroxyacyl-[acyl-carrier-protein] dehydratase
VLTKHFEASENMDYNMILEKLPYREPFLFVDAIISASTERLEGRYRFREDSWFYRGHFKDRPVTPGVLLTECCAQIGLACFGLYLLGPDRWPAENSMGIALTEHKMDFLRPVLPGEEVRVIAEKVYFRFGKIKSRVHLYTAHGELACRGELSGMVLERKP